jgi:adenosylmethionine-8-amino-7-oxononanoate aminotransferase
MLSSPATTNEEGDVTNEIGPPADYPIWHGSVPMKAFLAGMLRADRFLVAGDGIRVRDAAGRWFLDARSSCWNLGLGYSAAEVKDAIRRQLDELPNATLLAYDRPAEVTVEYARALRDAFDSRLPYVRFGNSGSQMTETAALVSRFARSLEGTPERTAILSFQLSYHGLGAGASAISGLAAAFNACGPLLPDVHILPIEGGWAANVARKLEELGPERTSAVIVEPQMGSRGVVPDPDDLVAVADLCREHGIHFVADEVTTGFGRTGAMSRCIDLGIEPDMVVLGKNVTSGYVPIGVLLVSEELYELAAMPDPPRILTAGSATDGHPVAAAAGLAVLRIYERDGILEHVREVGAFLKERLQALHAEAIGAGAGDVQGAGLMQLFPLVDAEGKLWPPPRLEQLRLACEEHGLLLSVAFGGVWVVPPLVSTESDCVEIVEALGAALEDVLEPAGEAVGAGSAQEVRS